MPEGVDRSTNRQPMSAPTAAGSGATVGTAHRVGDLLLLSTEYLKKKEIDGDGFGYVSIYEAAEILDTNNLEKVKAIIGSIGIFVADLDDGGVYYWKFRSSDL